MKSYFIFNTREGYYLVDNKGVDKVPKPRELIRKANAVEVLREFAEKQGIEFAVDKARKRTKHTQETKDKISAGVKRNPPHQNGISEEHRQKIIKAKRGKFRGENNNMYGKKHKYETKLKMSEKRRARGKYKQICNPYGYTLIPENDPIPEGYQPGKVYDPYRIID